MAWSVSQAANCAAASCTGAGPATRAKKLCSSAVTRFSRSWRASVSTPSSAWKTRLRARCRRPPSLQGGGQSRSSRVCAHRRARRPRVVRLRPPAARRGIPSSESDPRVRSPGQSSDLRRRPPLIGALFRPVIEPSCEQFEPSRRRRDRANQPAKVDVRDPVRRRRTPPWREVWRRSPLPRLQRRWPYAEGVTVSLREQQERIAYVPQA